MSYQLFACMCVPQARVPVAIGVFLPLAAVLLENLHLLFGPSPLILTPGQLEAFDRDGFIVLHEAVPPAMVNNLLDSLHHIQADAEAAGDATSEGAWDESASGADEKICTVAFSRDSQGATLRPPRVHKVQGIALNSTAVLNLLRHPPIAIAASVLVRRGLLADGTSGRERLEVDAFGTKYFPVRSGSPGSVGWHDDNYYFGTTRSNTISCVVYLRRVDTRSGCLRVLPGSHRDAAVGSERSRLYQSVPQQHGEYVPEKFITGELAIGDDGVRRAPADVRLAAGSVVLFDANLLHAVHPNRLVHDGGQPASERVAFHFVPGDLDTGFRGTSFARSKFADRHLAVQADGSIILPSSDEGRPRPQT